MMTYKDSESNADALREEIEQLKKHNAKAAEVIPALMDVNRELLVACKAMFKLVEDNDLVRNIENDGDSIKYFEQALRITKALQSCQDIIAKATK